MNTMRIYQVIFTFSFLFCLSCSSSLVAQGSGLENSSDEQQATSGESVESILEKLNKRTQELDSYQCQIEYRYVQPSVFNTQTLRKGMLYYSKQDGEPKLRVNFQTIKQNEDEEQKYNEQYIVVEGSALPKTDTKLEGIWLVQLDYEFKSVKFIQIAHASEPNQTTNVFDLISKNLPMVGFTKSDQLKEQFEITLPEQKNNEQEDIIKVHLKVKPNSVYKDDYAQIDCSIDEKLNLPVEIVAISTDPAGEPLEQKDFYEIKLLNAKTNEKIDKDVFKFEIPKGFDEPEIIR